MGSSHPGLLAVLDTNLTTKRLIVVKRQAGTVTDLASAIWDGGPDGFYTVRLHVDAAGPVARVAALL